MSLALLFNILTKLLIVFVCIDTGRKEGKSRRLGWFTLAALWTVQAIIIFFTGAASTIVLYLYLVIGPLTIWVSYSIRKMGFWSKLIEWSGAALIGAVFVLILMQ